VTFNPFSAKATTFSLQIVWGFGELCSFLDVRVTPHMGSSSRPKTPLQVAPGIKQFELQLASRTERDGNADGAGWRSADKLLVARLMPALSFLICRLSMQLGRVRSRMTTTRATTEPAGTTAGRPWGVAVYLYLCVLPVLCRIVL